MLKQLIHLDSIDGETNYDTILKTTHCYNTNIKINKPISNIIEISLKSLEMPLFYNNIRASNNSNLFSFKFTYSNIISIACTIPENNYTSINSLLTAINSSIALELEIYSGLSIVLSVVNTYYIQITHNCTSLTLNKCLLINYMLGFNNNVNSTSPIISTNFYCLNIITI